MRIISKPSDDPGGVYLTCISRIKSHELKERLVSVRKDIVDAAFQYDRSAEEASLFSLQEHGDIRGVVTSLEMEKVYIQRMAKKDSPGRSIYDRIKASASQGICPFCGQRVVSTIDHYLPKTRFPIFAVMPFNLVPACSDCNKLKLNKVPKSLEDQTFHPYYDNVEDAQWLYAEVIEEEAAGMTYFVDPPKGWSEAMKARVKTHFKRFELGSLYASHAGMELANIRFQITNIFNRAGSHAVRDHLVEAAESRYNNYINSWQTAMYQALSKSDWYCNGGFGMGG